MDSNMIGNKLRESEAEAGKGIECVYRKELPQGPETAIIKKACIWELDWPAVIHTGVKCSLLIKASD